MCALLACLAAPWFPLKPTLLSLASLATTVSISLGSTHASLASTDETITIAAADCAVPNRAAHVIYRMPPYVPHPLRVSGGFTVETVDVRVTVGASGNLTEIKIYKASGYRRADEAALDAARHSTYAAQIKDCKRVTGSLILRFRIIY
jgi:TonB family protein